MIRIIAILALCACAAVAQQAQAPPAFEVASVKVSAPPEGGRIRVGCPPSPVTFRCDNTPLRSYLVQAYGVKAYQIDGPAWLDTERYDINARIPEGAAKEQIPAMLQALLAERFKIVLHKETKPLPVYELAVAKGGSKLKEVDPAELNKPDDTGPGRGAAPPPPPPPPPGGSGGGSGGASFGVTMMMVGRGGGGGGARMTMNANGATTVSGKMAIGQLINMISRAVDRPVLDTTGLAGVYDIELTYLADNSPMIAMAAAAGGAAAIGAGGETRQPDASAPIATVFQALKTLGLTLEPKKTPFEIFVIDSANKVPTEN